MGTVNNYDRLYEIADKVRDSNVDYLFTPEEIFAQYLMYQLKDEIIIDDHLLWKAIEGYYSSYYDDTIYPMYILKLENLTEEEKSIFYDSLIDTFKKMYEITTDEWMKGLLKDWLNLE